MTITSLSSANIAVAVSATPTTLVEGGKIFFSGGKNGAWLCYRHKAGSSPSDAVCGAPGSATDISTATTDTNLCTAAQPEWSTAPLALTWADREETRLGWIHCTEDGDADSVPHRVSGAALVEISGRASVTAGPTTLVEGGLVSFSGGRNGGPSGR